MVASGMWSLSDGEYMNETHLNFFADRLDSMQKEVEDAQEASRSRLAGLGVASDELDMAIIEAERQEITRTLLRLETRASEIQHARQRIKEGEYGWCESTGEEIGIARLLALPTARFTAASQANNEASSQHYSTPRYQ